ncbi:MAG: hypothetical protein KDC44_19855, partial [Phaeodactylibacter sp.]|nr:hypothetical protein [Phaeodactylibacter sp.]
PPLCRTSFSPGQLNRMKRYALTKRRYLKWKLRDPDRLVAKGATQFKPMETLPDLKTAFEVSKLEPRSKALLIVWDPKSNWSERMFREVMAHEFYPYFMAPKAPYFLLTYSLEEYPDYEDFVDFMGNNVFAQPQDLNPEFELLRLNCSDYTAPAPGMYLITFRKETSALPRLAYAYEGYQKPREIRNVLDRYWSVTYKTGPSFLH